MWFKGLLSRIFGPADFGAMAVSNEIIPDTLSSNFEYPIGDAPHNANRDRRENDAALPMSQEEYNALLNKFNNLKSVPPAARREMGLQAIEENPKWVPGQNVTPKKPLGASSSFVKSIEINPQNQIKIRLGNRTEPYTFDGGNSLSEAAQAVLELINSPSIGRAVNTKIPGSWGRRHFDHSYSMPDVANNINAPSAGIKSNRTGYSRNK